MRRARTELSKESRKQFILDCAEQLILAEGLQNLSISGVSKKSNLAVGTIYLYFGSKEDIIAHLTLKSRAILLDTFVKQTSQEVDALAKVSALLQAFYSFYKEHPFYNQLVSFYETNAGLQENEELRAASLKINQLVVEILQEGKRQGTIDTSIEDLPFSFWLWGTTVGIIQLMEVKNQIISDTLHQTESDFYFAHISLIINSLKKK